MKGILDDTNRRPLPPLISISTEQDDCDKVSAEENRYDINDARQSSQGGYRITGL
jgi:hypothetical protein